MMLSGMVSAEQTPGRLFDDETLVRFRRVMPVMDMLNKRYSRDTVAGGFSRPDVVPSGHPTPARGGRAITLRPLPPRRRGGR